MEWMMWMSGCCKKKNFWNSVETDLVLIVSSVILLPMCVLLNFMCAGVIILVTF